MSVYGGDAGWGKGLGGRWKGSLGVLVAGGRERWNYGEEGGGVLMVGGNTPWSFLSTIVDQY